jgi:hypothetical protein
MSSRLQTTFVASFSLLLFSAAPAAAQFCESLLGPMQQGLSDREIASLSDLPLHVVRNCRRDLQRPIHIGPEGSSPLNAAGGPPRGAAGPAPRNPAGPPPVGAAGAPPVGRDIQRVP